MGPLPWPFIWGPSQEEKWLRLVTVIAISAL